QPVGGDPVGALVDVLGALGAQDLGRALEVAVGLGEGVLAVDEARACHVTQALDVGGGEVSHRWRSSPLRWCWPSRWPWSRWPWSRWPWSRSPQGRSPRPPRPARSARSPRSPQ